MSLKRKIAITGALLLLLSFTLVCLLIGGYFFLPFYLESTIIPQLAAEAGLSEFSINIRNIGFYSADLGVLRIGPRDHPAFVISSVQVDYSPRGLYQQKIKKLTLRGVELHAESANGKFGLRSIDLEKILEGFKNRHETARSLNDTSPAIVLERLEIRQSQIIIDYNERIYRILFELDIEPQDATYNELSIRVNLYPRGEEITANVDVNLRDRRAALRIDSATLNLDRFADITDLAGGLAVSGEANLQAKANLLWTPFRVSSFDASLTLHQGRIKGDGLQVQNATAADHKEIPFRVDLTVGDNKQLRISGGRLLMTSPAHIILTDFSGTMKRNDASLESTGNFNAVIQALPIALHPRFPVNNGESLPLKGRFSATYQQGGKWQCAISNFKPEDAAVKTVKWSLEPYTISSSIPEFNLSAKSEGQDIKATYMLTAAAVRMTSSSETVSIPKISLKGSAQSENTLKDTTVVNFNLQAPNTGVKFKNGNLKISKVAISGKLKRDVNRQITTEGKLQFSGAGGGFPSLDVQFTGLRGQIPFKWPVKGKTVKGNVSAADVRYKGLKIGRISSQIHQTADGFKFSGRHQNALLRRLKMNFSGESNVFTAEPARVGVRVEVSRPAGAPEVDLGKFYAKAKGVRIKGGLRMEADLALDTNGLGGNASADFNNGNLQIGDNNFIMEGISMSLSFPELPNIRSGPGQKIDFARISLGDFDARKGRIEFQIESARSVLIEKMHFRWCDGNVEAQSIRLIPESEAYNITFYCDRLNLAQVLEQFGAAAAEGQGSVNGRIPLLYNKGKIQFDDGFLFSTPGEGGKIHLSGTDILTAGIPPNTPQYVQMELAREALKDYDYSWAKLNLTSEGEELLLQMQMDGKPAQTLPFVYNKDIGGFMKVEANAKGSKFQGIRLDVNFRLPLNKLLQYKELMNMIQ